MKIRKRIIKDGKWYTKRGVELTRCGNTMTESEFFSLIRSCLRRLSLRWKPRNDYLNSIRRPYQGISKRSKWEYPCSICGQWFIKAHIEVDHIIPCGSIKSFEDIGLFINRLLIEEEGYRCLCKNCHRVVTNKN